MKTFYMISLATLASAVAVPAAAQDVAPGGARIEVQAGWDRISTHVDYDDGTTAVSGKGHKSDIGYGLETGYDFNMGSAIAGLYVGASGSGVKECSVVFGGDKLCLKDSRNFTAGMRVGFPVGSSALLYAKGGYSNGQVKVSYDDGVDHYSDHGNLDGWHVGAGAQFNLGSRTYAKVEYVYTNYSDYKYADATTHAQLGFDRHQVMAGVGYRF